MGTNPIFRNDSMAGMGSAYPYPYTEVEKRQLFLRSYQFSRRQSVGQRMKRTLFRVKRLIWARLRSTNKLHKIVWFRLRHGFFYGFRRKRFIPLNHHTTSLCLW